MNDFRTIIVPAANVDLARQLCALEPGGAGMLTTGLSADGAAPATHFISTGYCPPLIVQVCPVQTWEQVDGAWVEVGHTSGNPQAAVDAAQAADPPVPCTLAEVQALFDASDITEQEPFVAMSRLGLQIVNEGV